METAHYFFEKMRQCRRLAKATNDARTIEGLTILASEFEFKAKAAEARDRSAALLGNGAAGTLMPNDE